MSAAASIPRLLVALVIAMLLSLSLMTSAFAASITVNTTTDELNTDGDCSLREAIQAANTNAAVDACPTGQADPIVDVINVPAGTYQLTIAGNNEDGNATGDLDINGDLTLTGAAAATTIIDGGDLDRVIDIFGGDATVSGLTVQNGTWSGNGAGMRALSGSSLTLTDSVVRNNVAGGSGGGLYVHNSSTMTLRRVTVTGNDAFRGGGIYNNSDGEDGEDGGSPGLLIEDSTISSNRAIETEGGGHGGGVYNDDDTTLIGTTVNGNTADGNGGGVFNDGWDENGDEGTGAVLTLSSTTVAGNAADDGGGIYIGGINVDANGDATAWLTNSTISGNTAAVDGGGIFDNGGLELQFSTIASNTAASSDSGGGIFLHASASAHFYASIMANNAPDDCFNGDGSFDSLGSNLDSDNTCELDEVPSDQPDTDPKLGPLADNDAATQTHALLFDSPAVDAVQDMVAVNAVSGTCPATDQRGILRPQDGDSDGIAVCDIGAYELLPPAASITDVTVTEGNSGTVDAVFTVTLSRPSTGTVSFAYATANGTATVVLDYQAAASTVTFAPGDVSETITVKVVGDAIDEPNETFVVNLTAPVGATLADAQGTGTIVDDDAAAGLLSDTATAGGPVDAWGAPGLAIVVLAVSTSAAILVRRRKAIRAG